MNKATESFKTMHYSYNEAVIVSKACISQWEALESKQGNLYLEGFYRRLHNCTSKDRGDEYARTFVETPQSRVQLMASNTGEGGKSMSNIGKWRASRRTASIGPLHWANRQFWEGLYACAWCAVQVQKSAHVIFHASKVGPLFDWRYTRKETAAEALASCAVLAVELNGKPWWNQKPCWFKTKKFHGEWVGREGKIAQGNAHAVFATGNCEQHPHSHNKKG